MRRPILVTGTIAIVIISTMSTSCKKDVPFDEALIGKWDVQTEREIYSISDSKKFEYLYYYEANELAFEFTSGGNVIITQAGGYPFTTTYTLTGNKVTIETGDTDIIWEDSAIDGSTMTWSETGTDVINYITYDVEIIYTAAKK